MSLLRYLAAAAAVLHQVAVGSQDVPQQPIPDSYVCEHPPYKIYKVSASPLIIYIEDYLTVPEREHLKNISEGKFRRSAIAGLEGASLDSTRKSQSTYVDRDAIVRCIEDRALAFQGFAVPRAHLEPLQLVKYGVGEHYHYHTDWFVDPRYSFSFNGGNRQTSFFVYVHVSNDTSGGGTNFPSVASPTDERWCKFVDCDEPYENGVTFRPVEGNAIYWENLTPDGAGDRRTEHAGLPVTTGEKIGMNIWTRQAPLSEEARGPDVYPDV